MHPLHRADRWNGLAQWPRYSRGKVRTLRRVPATGSRGQWLVSPPPMHSRRPASRIGLFADETIGPETWGSRALSAHFEPCAELRRIILHHTAIRDEALANGDPLLEGGYMRGIERLHLDRGWIAVGYHFVIMPSGRVFAGRPAWALGSHTTGHNQGSLGIALAGNFEEEQPERAALRSLARLRFAVARHGRPLPLIAHGELGPTLCPGRRLREAVSAGHQGGDAGA